MELRVAITCLITAVCLQARTARDTVPDTVLHCCEGDVLFLLDSSGSVSSYEFSSMVGFLSELLRPFSLGPEEVRVGLLQVGTSPHLEFGFEEHRTQHGLQAALQNTRQLRGDTNTVGALKLAQERVLKAGGPDGTRPGLPRVLVWLTDGVQPGEVEAPMAQLREEGVSVLVVSTGRGNYQVLRRVVTPPADNHLYFVDIDDMSIITKDLRDAIIEIIRAERLQVRNVTAQSATLHWRPVLSASTGLYDIRFGPVRPGGGSDGGAGGTSPSTEGVEFQRLTKPGDATWAKLTGLRPDTTYTATLTPESNVDHLRPLSVTFTTKPEVLSPAVVTVSESGVRSVRVSWGPLQPELVERYTVEYSPLPRGELRVLTVSRHHNSTLLTQMEPDTQYLITISALHTSGQERAMSVKACTQEDLPALADLSVTSAGSDSVQVQWRASTDRLRGYWLTWGPDHSSSSRYLPPHMLKARLGELTPGTRVCVSPVYRTARGEGLCCAA